MSDPGPEPDESEELEYVFPDNVLHAIGDCVSCFDGVNLVVYRPLRATDPNGTVGLTSDEWVPNEVEIGPLGFEPALSTYLVTIEHIVKHESVEIGNHLARSVAKQIKSMLYRGQDLGLAFRALSVADNDYVERTQKWEVLGQRFGSNEGSNRGTFVSVSVTDFSFQTETTTS